MVCKIFLDEYVKLFLRISVFGKYKNILEISVLDEYKKDIKEYKIDFL